MRLFVALRWGHDGGEDGPDDYPTVFLVRACSVQRAAEIADELLGFTVDERINRYCALVYYVGLALPKSSEGLCLGPSIEQGHVLGGVPCWERSGPDSDWLFVGHCLCCGLDVHGARVEPTDIACPACGWGKELFEETSEPDS